MNINWSELEADDLPSDLEEIANDMGIDFARYLVESWGGSNLYIPTLSRLRRARRDRLIAHYYDGTNEGDIARSLGMSRRQVHNVIHKYKKGE
jgi:Mor family transcriptional regulator